MSLALIVFVSLTIAPTEDGIEILYAWVLVNLLNVAHLHL